MALVAQVEDGSPAERAGVLNGDRLLAINGLVPRDVIDVRADADSADVSLDVERCGERLALSVVKEPDEDLGVSFGSPVFDGMKTCNNSCDFCFIRGLPAGLRRSLYLKDDDYRYSFLYGSFTTLTNLSDAEWNRIGFQRISPLRVSVHATRLELRRELLANPRAPDIRSQLDELGAWGVRVHAQVVLMPGRNDGAYLDETLDDLFSRHPTVESTAVVPVGLTEHSRPAHTRPLTAEDAAEAIRAVERRQRAARRDHGTGVVYAADELYLLAGRPLPSARAYDDYPQLQNGVGLVRLFLEGWKRATRRLPASLPSRRRVTWATGASMAPVFREMADNLRTVENLSVAVTALRNSLFGGSVTVAGLITGADVVSALREVDGDCVVLSRSMFDAELRHTIDGWGVDRMATAVGREMIICASPQELLAATLGEQQPFRGARGPAVPRTVGNEAGEKTCAAS